MIILRRNHEVMPQVGTGFTLSASNGERAGVRCRKSADSNGPIMVENVKVGDIAWETLAKARANRKYLEVILAAS